MSLYSIHIGDCIAGLRAMDAGSVRTCVTSPPYWGLRDYGSDGQLGLEPTPDEYVANMVAVFREVRRVLTDDGTLWLNLGDSYFSKTYTNRNNATGGLGGDEVRGGGYLSITREDCGLKNKDLCGIPWRVAFALQADGWYLRQDIIWHKPNPMPESVADRCTKAHEYIFLLSKSARYYYDAVAVAEKAATEPHAPGNKKLDDSRNDHDQMEKVWGANGTRNRRSVWTVATKPYPEAHFATYPPALIEPCILAGSELGDTVLDPFTGSGTTGMVAMKHGRRFVGCELNHEYAAMAERRIAKEADHLFAEVDA